MQRKVFLFFLTIGLLSAHCVMYAQYSDKSFIINYPKDIYKGQSQNWSLSKTEDGILYVGNNEGLIEFDGSNWSMHKMPEQMVVRSVSVGNDGKVFVGAYEEFGYFSYNENNEFSYTSISEVHCKENFHNDEIWRIIPLKDKVYFQSFSSIFVFDGTEVSKIETNGTVVLLIRLEDRLFIHKVGDGLYEIKDDSMVFLSGSQLFASDEIKMILKLKNGNLLIGGSVNGLYQYDGIHYSKWESEYSDEIKNAEINNAIALDNYLIIGTIVNGIYILNYQGKLVEHLSTRNFLQNNTVLALAADGKDKFWAGLDQGLDHISLNNIVNFYINPVGSPKAVYDAIIDGESLLLGTNQGLFKYTIEPNGFVDPVLLKNSQGQVWDLKRFDNDLLCGHTNGTFRIENNNFTQISAVNGGFELKEVIWKSSKYLLQSTYSLFTVYTKVDDHWKFSHTLKGFTEPIPHFEFDHLGNIWASHSNRGVFLLRPDNEFKSISSSRYFGKEEGFHSDRKIILAKVDNRIVFCTNEIIYTYDDLNDRIIPYDFLNDGLGEFKASSRIVSIGDEKYWCINENKVALYKIALGEINQLFQYDFSSSGVYLTSNFAGISRLKDSVHLICLDNGFAIYKEEVKAREENEIKPILRKINIGTKNALERIIITPDRNEIKIFPHSIRHISFTFSANQISVAPNFSYKLEGMDDTWSNASTKSQVNYNWLPAGDFSFQLKSITKTGEVSEIEYFNFRIKKAWYFSLLALFFYSLIFIAGIVILRLSFLKRLKIQSEKLKNSEYEKRRRDKIIAEQDIIKLRNDKLNSEVSLKNMQLANYTMTLIGKNELLIKIKEEIIRQKTELGGRYPNYYFDKVVSMIDSNISTDDDWKVFEMHFDQANEHFFKRLKSEFSDLTHSDMKLCAYLRLNLSTKEIAPLLNISVRGVEIRRYRLRKRLNLTTEEGLVEFLLAY
ncbi:MAG: hypothetical protein K9H49_16950 [Bacteroidales bacterium]|nr:hypothetical protein [Bacteroidales bacterium]MCF8391001.1 hypothetical protein [Bacteroidales bacterium]